MTQMHALPDSRDLKMIERELRKEIAWINSRPRPLGDRMEAAAYAYRKAIKIVQNHHVIFSQPLAGTVAQRNCPTKGSSHRARAGETPAGCSTSSPNEKAQTRAD